MFCDRKVSSSARVPVALAGLLTVAVLLAPLAGYAVTTSTVELRISVVNPLDREQSKEVRSNLPSGIGAGDVLDLDGLELRYDTSQDRFYVYRVVNLEPKQRRDFRVTMRDVWVLPEETLTALEEQAGSLSDLLRDTDEGAAAVAKAQAIQEDMVALRGRQARYSIAAGARAADHIRAYHINRATLEAIRQRLGKLENMALGQGLDPGRLLGTLAHAPRPALDPDEIEQPNAGEAVMRITVRNTSPDRPRSVVLRRDLPREIKPQDVLDADGLEVAVDPSRDGMVYVLYDDLELAPAETRIFEVRLRDRWNVHEPRIDALEEVASELLDRVRGMEAYPSVASYLDDVISEIEAIRAEPVPETLDDRYVAFFRARGQRLDELAEKIGRVESALRPGEREQRLGFDVRPPDPRTTWLVIYVILGFLGVVSLLFFLRWYGKERS